MSTKFGTKIFMLVVMKNFIEYHASKTFQYYSSTILIASSWIPIEPYILSLVSCLCFLSDKLEFELIVNWS